MNKKTLYIGLISLYLATLAINFFVSMKFPDTTIEASHFIASFILFITVLFAVTQSLRYINGFLLVGGISSIFVAVAQYFNDLLINNWLLDMVAGFQYPIYVLFITPWFGLNILINALPGTFAFCCAGLFAFLYVVSKITTWRIKGNFNVSN